MVPDTVLFSLLLSVTVLFTLGLSLVHMMIFCTFLRRMCNANLIEIIIKAKINKGL